MQEIDATATVPQGPPTRLRGLASYLVAQLRVAGHRAVADRLGRPGARTEYAVFAALDEFGALSQAEIGRRLGIDRGDLVALLNRLGDEGVLTRSEDPADRRRNLVSLKPAGRRQLKQMDTAVLAAQDDLLAPLSRAERATFVTLLQRLADHHRGATP